VASSTAYWAPDLAMLSSTRLHHVRLRCRSHRMRIAIPRNSYAPEHPCGYLINRYYDPATDQFLSVDPLVERTGEPYAFTGDDPLNATDPLGLKGWYCIAGYDGQAGYTTHYFKGNKYGAANGACIDGHTYAQVAAFALAYEAWLARNSHSAVTAGPSAASQAVSDYINWGNQNANNLYISVCGAFILIACYGMAGRNHVSIGFGVGVPGISATMGGVQGATADQYLCGESVTVGGAYGPNLAGGAEVGMNPRTGDSAFGIQVGTPGFGAFRTWGTC